MQKKSDGFEEFSMEQAAALSQSAAAKELFALLKSTNADRLQMAMRQASGGDLSNAKQTIQQMLAAPEAQELLKKLQG